MGPLVQDAVDQTSQYASMLSTNGVKYVRVALLDPSNILRYKVMPVEGFLKLIRPGKETRGIFQIRGIVGFLPYKDVLVPGLPAAYGAVGELCMVPDPTSLRVLPYGSRAHAICFVDFFDKEEQFMPVPGCARSTLRNVVKRADDLGLSFLCGFESEVIFLSETNPPKPIDYATYASSQALHSEETSKMVDEIVDALTAQGIGVSQFHAEAAPGQFEFVTDPYSPLQTADYLVLTRETIYNITKKYGIKATFAPKVFPDYLGSGCHCHISVQDNGDKFKGLQKGPNGPNDMPALEEKFMAGILKHLRAIAAFSMPNTLSYDRMQEGGFSGFHIGWGIDNKEAPLRLAYSPNIRTKSRNYRCEVKPVDGLSNPYLVLAAILTAGLDGITSDVELPMKELTVSTALMTKEERLANGVTEHMPTSIEEALDALRADYAVFSSTMGTDMVDIYLAARAGDAKHMEGLTNDERLSLIIRTF